VPGHRSSTLASETREWPVGKGKNREKARILALAHQVQPPALNGQIDQQPLDSHQAANTMQPTRRSGAWKQPVGNLFKSKRRFRTLLMGRIRRLKPRCWQ
jgi:hypothetical protein